MQKSFSIAIDGPVAAGKGTIAPMLAKRINGFYLYTGAMYRSLALMTIEENINPRNEEKILKLLPKAEIELIEEKVLLNGKDVTQRIREQDVASIVPIISAYSRVREVMLGKQREIADKTLKQGKFVVAEEADLGKSIRSPKAVVAEGRDTATKLFPDADLKIFLTASPRVRAERRLAQLKSYGYRNISTEQVLEDIKKRDKEDMERKIDPLVSNPRKHGYFILDDSNLSETETINLIVEELRKRGLIE